MLEANARKVPRNEKNCWTDGEHEQRPCPFCPSSLSLATIRTLRTPVFPILIRYVSQFLHVPSSWAVYHPFHALFCQSASVLSSSVEQLDQTATHKRSPRSSLRSDCIMIVK